MLPTPKKGVRPGGRKKGTPNKTTADCKAALTAAFEGLGGVPKLQAWAKEHPTAFYKLWAKLLPTDINATVGANIDMTIKRYVFETPPPAPSLNETPAPNHGPDQH